MSACYKFEGRVLDQKQLVDSITEKLQSDEFLELRDYIFSIQQDITKELDTIIRSSEKKVGDKDHYIGVSTLLEQPLYVGERDVRGNPIKSILSPIYNKENRIANSIDSVLPLVNNNKDAAIKLIEEQITEESAIADVGDLIHNLIHIAFKNHNGENFGYISKEFQEEIEKAKNKIENSKDYEKDGQLVKSLKYILEFKETSNPTIEQIIEKIISIVKNVEESIYNNPAYQGSRIYTEVDIATDNIKNIDNVQGVGGRTDLMIVKPDGSIDIIDFKISSRSFNDWYLAKQLHTDYQLGFYRAILASQGLNSTKIKLQVLPIHFPIGKFSQMKVETMQNRVLSSGKSISHLDNDLGSFTKKINYLFTFPVPKFVLSDEDLSTTIQESLNKIINPFKSDKRNYSKEELLNRIFAKEIGGKTKYVLIDINTGDQIIRNSKEEFEKSGILDRMLAKQENLLVDTMEHIIEMIDQYKASGKISDDYEFRNNTNDDNKNVYNVLNSTFGKYCSQKYERVSGEAGKFLANFRIIAFKNVVDNTIDVICLSDQNLRNEILNHNSNTVLGKFYTNDQARRLQLFATNTDRKRTVGVMPSTSANMELIQVMGILNTMPEIFENSKLGLIKVINPQIGQSEVPDIDELKANFNVLTNKAQLTNNFDSKIQTTDMWEFMLSELNTLVYNAEPDNKLKEFVSGISEMNLQTKQAKIDNIIALREKLRRNYQSTLIYSDFKSQRSFNRPEQVAYYILSQALNYYHDMPIGYNGKLSKWGLHFGEIGKLLGTPFYSNQSDTLNNGYKSAGFLQGLDLSTPSATPSDNLRALFRWYDTAYAKLRKDFFKQVNRVNNICRPFISGEKSQLYRVVLNDTSNIWESFMEHTPAGKLSPDLKIKNPYTDQTLSKDEQQFLKEILWELNKWRIPGLDSKLRNMSYTENEQTILDTESVKSYMGSPDYFYLPLRRAVDFYKLKNLDEIGIKNWLVQKWDSLKEDFDPRKANAVSSFEVDGKVDENTTQMYHAYKMSSTTRQSMIQEEGVRAFELDLNLLAADMAYQTMRKQYYEEVLELTDSVATALHYLQSTSDSDYTPEIQALDDQSKVSIKNKQPFEDELKDSARAIGIAKKLNSFIVLAFRPLQFLKELTFGQFTNYSRAWALKDTSTALTAKSVFEANKIVWGQSLRKYGDVFKGEGDIADFTLVEALNKIYGIANEDINSIVDKATLGRTGLYGGLSKWMYISNSAPDYFNRMTLFISKMLEDKCFEAHSLDKDGNLIYDFKKDLRFSELNKYGILDSEGNEIVRNDKLYNEQRGLYRIMLESLIQEGITNEDGSELKFGDNLPRAYTNRQKQSIKEVADIAYGFYDHETKSLQDHKFFGLVFKQFMAFWTAKTTLWFKGKGANTSQGRFVEAKTENGEIIYRRIVEDSTGKLLVELVKESELRPEEIGILEPQYVWKGDYTEGLLYSIGGAFNDIIHANWEHLINDKQQLGNLKLALHDLLIGVILFQILKWIFSGGSGKMSDTSPTERTLLRAMQDVGPSGLTSLSFEPSFYSTLTNLQEDLPKFFSSDNDFYKFISRRFSAVKDFTSTFEED